jgi:5-methylcytosine-specific restriction endonuclease McrA
MKKNDLIEADFLLHNQREEFIPQIAKDASRGGLKRNLLGSNQSGVLSLKWLTKDNTLAPIEKCSICQKNDTYYEAKGLCHNCYQRKWQEEHPDYNKNQCNKQHSLRGYDGKRVKVLERDKSQCTMCGNKKYLIVHHKDNSGRIKDGRIFWNIKPNNELSNLITLCQSCHIKLHNTESKTNE